MGKLRKNRTAEKQAIYEDLAELKCESAEEMEIEIGGSATHGLADELKTVSPNNLSNEITQQTTFIGQELSADISKATVANENGESWGQYQATFTDGNMKDVGESIAETAVSDLKDYLNAQQEVLTTQGVDQFVQNVKLGIEQISGDYNICNGNISASDIANAWHSQEDPEAAGSGLYTSSSSSDAAIQHLEMKGSQSSTLQEQAQVQAIESVLDSANQSTETADGMTNDSPLAQAIAKENAECGNLLETLEQEGHLLDANGITSFLKNVETEVSGEVSSLNFSSTANAFSVKNEESGFLQQDKAAISAAESTIIADNASKYEQFEESAGIQLTNSQVDSEAANAENQEVEFLISKPQQVGYFAQQKGEDGGVAMLYQNETVGPVPNATNIANQVEMTDTTMSEGMEIASTDKQLTNAYGVAESFMKNPQQALQNAEACAISEIEKGGESEGTVIEYAEQDSGITIGLQNLEMTDQLAVNESQGILMHQGPAITATAAIDQLLGEENQTTGTLGNAANLKQLVTEADAALNITTDVEETNAIEQIETDYSKYGAFDLTNHALTSSQIEQQVINGMSNLQGIGSFSKASQIEQQDVQNIEGQLGITQAQITINGLKAIIAEDSTRVGEINSNGVWSNKTLEASTSDLSADAYMVEEFSAQPLTDIELAKDVRRMYENENGVSAAIVAQTVENSTASIMDKAQQLGIASDSDTNDVTATIMGEVSSQVIGYENAMNGFNITQSRQDQVDAMAKAILKQDGVWNVSQQVANLEEEQAHPNEYALANGFKSAVEWVEDHQVVADVVGAVAMVAVTVATAGAADVVLGEAAIVAETAEAATDVAAAGDEAVEIAAEAAESAEAANSTEGVSTASSTAVRAAEEAASSVKTAAEDAIAESRNLAGEEVDVDVFAGPQDSSDFLMDSWDEANPELGNPTKSFLESLQQVVNSKDFPVLLAHSLSGLATFIGAVCKLTTSESDDGNNNPGAA